MSIILIFKGKVSLRYYQWTGLFFKLLREKFDAIYWRKISYKNAQASEKVGGPSWRWGEICGAGHVFWSSIVLNEVRTMTVLSVCAIMFAIVITSLVMLNIIVDYLKPKKIFKTF